MDHRARRCRNSALHCFPSANGGALLQSSVRHGHLVATSVMLRRHGLRLHWWGGIVPHSHAGAASAADSSCVHSLWTVLRSGFSRHRSHLSPFWSCRHMTSIRSVSVLATAAFALIATSSASADVVTSTFSGIGSGTWFSGIYSGQSFTNKAFTFTTSVDTSSISAFSAVSSLPSQRQLFSSRTTVIWQSPARRSKP